MRKTLRSALVVSVVGVGSWALGNAGLLAFPDTGGGGSDRSGVSRDLQLAALTPPCEAPEAGEERVRQLEKSLEALGLAVD